MDYLSCCPNGEHTPTYHAHRHALCELHEANIILNPAEKKPYTKSAIEIKPNAILSPNQHFYPNVLNTMAHPVAKQFFGLTNRERIERYLGLNPGVDRGVLEGCLDYKPKYFCWAGSDLFHVLTPSNAKRMIVVETNSCPAGQKSMPAITNDRYSGYRTVLENSFKHITATADPTLGSLAVIYDKNEMEVSAYAHLLSQISNEPVYLVEFTESDPDPPVKFTNGIMHVRDSHSLWHPIRACFRYVTQKPWNRIPTTSRTIVMNSVLACLCGGRNKSMAAHAYNTFNEELKGSGLKILIPETIVNLSREQIPSVIEAWGGKGVIKVPYSNAGQGVYTVLNSTDLAEFMGSKCVYEKYLVQRLVEPAAWRNPSELLSEYYHVGTALDSDLKSYVNDIRMMVCGGTAGFQPVSIYSRRARKHITSDAANSWDMLGTNLSVKSVDSWNTEADRLILMDRRDFGRLDLNLNDLIDGYVQTCLSVIAIDKLCQTLVRDGRVDLERFRELNPDRVLLAEMGLES